MSSDVAVALAQHRALRRRRRRAAGRAECRSRRDRSSRPCPRRAAARTRSGAPCPWPGARAATCGSTRARAASVRWRLVSGFLFDREPLLLLLEPARVVAFPRIRPRAIELEDPAGDVVEKVAVVRDGDDRALVFLAGSARARRPTRRRDGSSARRAAAGRATAAGAGRARRGGARRPRASSRRRRPAGSRSASIACSSFESRSHAPAASIASCTRACSSSTFSISSGDSSSPNFALISSKRVRSARIERHAFFDVAEHGLRRVEHGLLRQKADREAGRQRGLTLNFVIEARHDLEQRRLARAVRSDDADLRAVEKREPDVLEDDRVGRIRLAQTLHGVDELRHDNTSS